MGVIKVDGLSHMDSYLDKGENESEVKVSSLTYPLHKAKHEFAKHAVRNDFPTAFKLALLSAFIVGGGVYSSFDKMEDNISSAQAPQALERIANEMTSLSKQKADIDNIRIVQDSLEFDSGQSEFSMSELETLEDRAIDSFERSAGKTLDYILASKHLSETQISDAWHDFSERVVEPEDVRFRSFNNSDDYDFGFVKECRAEATSSYTDNLSDWKLARKIDRCISYDSGSNRDMVYYSVMSGLFSTLSFIPILASLESGTMKKWAREKPTKNKKHKYGKY